MKHQILFKYVEKVYRDSKVEFADWMWENHVPVVARNAQELSVKYGADENLVVAGALLHDFGDAFIDRYNSDFKKISREESIKVLVQSGYQNAEITKILEEVIAPHSCHEGNFPESLEGKLLATADALAHLGTDFYVQFVWLHRPKGKTYEEFLSWVNEKLDRDYTVKIFFEEERQKVQRRYESLKDAFRKA